MKEVLRPEDIQERHESFADYLVTLACCKPPVRTLYKLKIAASILLGLTETLLSVPNIIGFLA